MQANQCLEDLEIHFSAVIAELRRDLEAERNVCETIREAYEQQVKAIRINFLTHTRACMLSHQKSSNIRLFIF